MTTFREELRALARKHQVGGLNKSLESGERALEDAMRTALDLSIDPKEAVRDVARHAMSCGHEPGRAAGLAERVIAGAG